MRCSWFESRLDAYVEGELTPLERARVAGHVAECADCARLLEEFRAIDALLVTRRQLEPAPNFRFKVMADVRDLPLPHRHHLRTPHAAVFAAYLVFAWLVIGAFFFFDAAAAHGALALLAMLGSQVARAYSIAAGMSAHAFGSSATAVSFAMIGVLAIDALLAVGALRVYASVRRRLVAESAS